MTYLSRLTKLGLAKETTPYTWLAPTISVPFNKASFKDDIIPLKDESVRANDSVLQGLNQGPWTTVWDVETNAYADLMGYFLRGIIGSDTVTAGVSTTLASNCSAGATTLSLTASVASNTVIQISDAGGTKLEWVQVGTVTGSGPYSAPVTTPATGTKFAHTAAGGSVLSQSTHVFKQNRSFATIWPTYSWTTDDGTDQLGWPGNVFSDVQIKIDSKGFVTVMPKSLGFPSVTESTFAYAASTVQPPVGWAWTTTNAGGTSTRGLSFDLTLKRATEGIQTSDGTQAPREIFAGALEADGAYKAVFENDLDMNLFKQYSFLPTVHTITQPATSGGAILVLTMSYSGYTTGDVDVATPYVQISQNVAGIQNSTDTGVVQASLTNFISTAY